VTTPREPATRTTLRRGIGLIGFFALAFGSMIGVGWVTALGSWFAQAGPLGAMLAFLAGGLLMITIGLCYAELTPMLPVAGGEVAYAYRASGTAKAFVVGWALAFGYLSVSAFEAISVGRVLAFLIPGFERWPLYEVAGSTVHGSSLLLGVVTTAAITWVNYRGVQSAMRLQVVLTAAFLLVVAIFVGAGFLGGDFAHLAPAFPTTGASPWGGALAVFVTAPFWFVGFDTIPQAAEEAEAGIPLRKLGVILLVSIVMATAFYVTLILAVAVTGPWTNLAGHDLPTAHAFGRVFQSTWMVRLVLLAALLGLFTSWNGFFLAGSRVLFALARARIIPARLARTDPRYGTPAAAVWLSGAVTLLGALLGRGAMLAFVNVGSFCIAVAFLGVTQATMTLRRSAPDLPRPYRIPGGRLIPMVATIGAAGLLLAMVLPMSPAALKPLEWGILLTFSGVGLALWTAGRRQRVGMAESERARLILGEHGGT
jgi:basic amino acid/polyamine antiporter, APA family